MAVDFLTFELSPAGDEVEIHGDAAGLRRLAETLRRLAGSRLSDHEHLATPEWAGDELSSEKQSLDNDTRVINQVTIRCWVPEEKAKP